MKKSVRTILVLLGVSLTLGVAAAPEQARAEDCAAS